MKENEELEQNEEEELDVVEFEENLFNQASEENEDGVSLTLVGYDEEGEGSKNMYGLWSRCPLNQLKSFHAVLGFPPDCMHDLLEGVVTQDWLGVVKIMVEEG